MTQYYSDPNRANEPYALPDLEVWYAGANEFSVNLLEDLQVVDCVGNEAGWYYWFCFPGCLPDSDPEGPFDSEAEALAYARQLCED